jgi:hypothetical protein
MHEMQEFGKTNFCVVMSVNVIGCLVYSHQPGIINHVHQRKAKLD